MYYKINRIINIIYNLPNEAICKSCLIQILFEILIILQLILKFCTYAQVLQNNS